MREFDLFSLKGKVVVITGSTGGLGSRFVDHVAWAGADIAVVDMVGTEEKLSALCEKINTEYGTNIKGYTIDMLSEENIKSTRDAVLLDFGHIDGLLNVAGMTQQGTVQEYVKEDLDRILSVNVTGTFLCCKYFGEPMLAQKSGSIVNIASVSGTIVNRAPRELSAYCISKAGVIHSTKAIAAEYGKHNVRVNAVSPGFMQSRMSSITGKVVIDPAVNEQYLVGGTPMNRYGQPDELPGAAIYLLSDASTFTNGIDLVVDGGFLVW